MRASPRPRCRYPSIGQTVPLKIVPIHFGAPATAAPLTASQNTALRAALAQQFGGAPPATATSGGFWSTLTTPEKVGVGVAGVALVAIVIYAARKSK